MGDGSEPFLALGFALKPFFSVSTGTDKTYARYLKRIGEITEERNELASRIKTVLNNAEFHNQPVDEGAEDGLGHRAKALIDEVTDQAERDHDF